MVSKKTKTLLAALGIAIITGTWSGANDKASQKYKPLSVNETQECQPLWGKIANEELENEKIATTLYFPGVPKAGIQEYANIRHYTAHPRQGEEGFSEEDISKQLQRMKSIGVNTVQISYWGRNPYYGSDGLPMDACDGNQEGKVLNSYKRFIEQIEKEGMYFFPLIEVNYFFPLINLNYFLHYFRFLDINIPNPFCFLSEFPDNTEGLENRTSWWVEHFGYSDNWLKVYDKTGTPRKVVSLIETIKPDYPKLDPSPFDPFRYDAEEFSEGFKEVAEKIRDKYEGIEIGFSIDPTPIGTSIFYGKYHPEPNDLKDNDCILFVLPWDITNEGRTDDIRLNRAKETLQKWRDYPIVSFVLPGWNASVVFPGTKPYGMTNKWKEGQKQLAVSEIGNAGISVGPWNGWTEWFHITCSEKTGDANLKWAKEIIDINNRRIPDSSEVNCTSY